MADQETINCNICESNDSYFISDKGQFGLPLHVVICKSCGLSYLNPRWKKEKYMDFYKNDYDKYYRPSILGQDSIDNKNKNPIVQRININKVIESEPMQILDIGSGEGENITAFKGLYKNAAYNAIEPSSRSRELLSNLGVNIIHEDVESDWHLNYQGKFDLVILRHVLEHLMDPVGTLKKIRETLSDRGILYIAVPNNLSPTSNLESHWFRVVHTYYFNVYSLDNICKKADLKILHMQQGDKFNRGEVFLFVKRSTRSLDFKVDTNHFLKQKNIFLQELKYQNNWLYPIVKRMAKKIKNILAFSCL